MRRKRSCEICGAATGALSEVDGGTRLLVLCEAHVGGASAGVASVEALRALFVEADGRRALLSRRAVDERRMFPLRPEGRRLSRGRRKSDGPRPRGIKTA
jgi:hypothetical protein